MNIDFNSFFRLRVDIIKIKDQFQLTMERIDLEDNFHSSKDIYFLDKEQLKQFVNYVNEATNDLI
jgi:hypothetical protein